MSHGLFGAWAKRTIVRVDFFHFVEKTIGTEDIVYYFKLSVSTEAFEGYAKNHIKFALYSPIIFRKIHRDSSSCVDNSQITILTEKLLNV